MLNVLITLIMTLSSFMLFAVPSFIDESRNKATEVHIGIYAPFSNQHAVIGRSVLAALEMGEEQLKSPQIHYSFYTLDQQNDTKRAQQILHKFIKKHDINVLVTAGSKNGLLASSLAKDDKLIHFSVASDPAIADGNYNFLILNTAQNAQTALNTMRPDFIRKFKETYWNMPVTEAGYAFDVFHILHQSIMISLKSKPIFSRVAVAENIHLLAAGSGVMGHANLDKQGVIYTQLEGESDKPQTTT